jgi:hypothetical protein
MLSSETWKLLDLYKDIIGNGLDLLSVILVAPQLFRIVAPALRSLTSMMIVVAVFVVGGFITLAALSRMHAENYLWSLIFLLFFFGALFTFDRLTDYVNDKVVLSWSRFSGYAFVLGIVIFLISRLVALTIAAQQLLSQNAG